MSLTHSLMITSHVAKGRIYQVLYNDHTQDRLELHTRCRWDLPFQLIERCRPLGELYLLAEPLLTPSPRMRLSFSAPRRPLQDLWLRLKGCVQHELSSTSRCTKHRPSQHKSLDHFDLRKAARAAQGAGTQLLLQDKATSILARLPRGGGGNETSRACVACCSSGHTCF